MSRHGMMKIEPASLFRMIMQDTELITMKISAELVCLLPMAAAWFCIAASSCAKCVVRVIAHVNFC